MQTVENVDPVLGPSVHTRASLIARVRDWSDDESWDEFFALYWKLLYSVAVKAGLTESEAEEAVQATMISISKNIRDFQYNRQTGSFRSWICKQAWWKINDQLRRRQREQQRLKPPSVPRLEGFAPRTATVARVPDAHNDFENFVEDDFEKAVQRLALDRVRTHSNPKHFQMFDLYVTKKWPIREVARLLQVNPAQVYLAKSRISRQLKKTTKLVAAQLERQPPAVGKKG